jgi:hypothetical protein
MLDNHIYASLVFTIVFLASVCTLLFILAWLEQPASERRKPDRWARSAGSPQAAADTGGWLQVAASWER